MDQGRALQSLIPPLASEISACDTTQLLVHQGNEGIPSLFIAIGPAVEQLGHLVGSLRRGRNLKHRPGANRLVQTSAKSWSLFSMPTTKLNPDR